MPTQGSVALAKDDTHFLSETGGITDTSQYGSNWTQAGATNCFYSDNGTRWTSSTTRVVEVGFEADTGSGSAVIASQGGDPVTVATANGITVGPSAATAISVWIASASEATISAPGLSGTLQIGRAHV